MKKLLTVIFLCGFLQTFAQDSIPIRTASRNEDNFKLFLGGGASFNNGFELNRLLEQNNIVPLQPVEGNFVAGLIFFNNDIDVELMYDMLVNGKSNETTKYRTIANGVKLRAQWQVIRFKKATIGAGLNIGYSHRKLSLYWKDTAVDFNNLGDFQGNQLTMFLERSTIGPAISVRFKDTSRNHGQTKITLAYEIGMNNKSWEAGYFDLQNNITENKSSQLLLNATLIL